MPPAGVKFVSFFIDHPVAAEISNKSAAETAVGRGALLLYAGSARLPICLLREDQAGRR